MAAEIQIVSTLDNDQTISGLVETEQTAKKTADGIDKAAKATLTFKQQLKELKKEEANLTLDERIQRVKDVFESAPASVDKLTAEIKEYQSIALAAGRETPIGREFLAKAASAKDVLVDLQNETKRLSDDNKNLQGVIQGIGVGVSAFGGVTAAATLFGDKNEELQQVLIRVTAAQTLLNSVQQIQVALQKESSLRLALNNGLLKAQTVAQVGLTAATGIYNAVVGTSTGVLKAFRLALLATGIGAIVVGIGLLIANFDSLVGWVSDAVDAFGGLGNIIATLLGPVGFLLQLFGLLGDETNALSAAEEEAARKRREQIAELGKQTQERLDQIDEVREAEAEAFADRQSAFDLEIDRLEAEGKASFELKRQKLQDIIDEEKAILESNVQKTQAWIEYYTNLAAINGQSTEDFKKQLKLQGIDVDELLAEVTEKQEAQRDKIFAAETDLIKLETENNKKRAQDAANTAKEIERIETELFNRRVEAIAALDELEAASIEDDLERQQVALMRRFEQRVATLSSQIPEEQALILALEQQLQEDLLKLDQDYAAKQRQQFFEEQQKLDELRIQIKENQKVAEEEQLVLDKEIAELRFLEEVENLRFQLETQEITEEEFRLRRELLQQEHEAELTSITEEGESNRQAARMASAQEGVNTAKFFVSSALQIAQNFDKIIDNNRKRSDKEEEKAQKRRFNRDKAFKIALAAINGAAAVLQAIGQFGPPPSPLGIAGIITAGVLTATQIAVIASQKFEPSGSGGGGGGGGGAATAGFSSAISAGASTPSPNVPTTTTETGGTSSATEEDLQTGGKSSGAGSTTLKAYVVQNELADANDAAKQIESQATL